MAESLRIERRLGEDIAPVMADIAQLRLQIFREWPYLYAGDEALERDYLSRSLGSPRALAVLAWAGAHMVGAATAMPMGDEDEHLRQPVAAAGFDPRRVFYFGESVLLPRFRGQGYGGRFLGEREEHARGLGYAWSAFCAVERSAADPRRPADWLPLDAFWRRRNYTPSDATTTFVWKEVGEGVATDKLMRFWFKSLA